METNLILLIPALFFFAIMKSILILGVFLIAVSFLYAIRFGRKAKENIPLSTQAYKLSYPRAKVPQKKNPYLRRYQLALILPLIFIFAVGFLILFNSPKSIIIDNCKFYGPCFNIFSGICSIWAL